MKLSLLSLVTSEETDKLSALNDTRADVDLGTGIVELFERQVVLHSGSAASVGSGGLSYGELNVRANRIAHALMARGVGPEVPVVLCFERSSELLAGLLGIWKAGGCYVPLDPEYPASYLAQIVEDAHPAVVLADRTLAGRLGLAGERALYLDDAEVMAAPEGNPGVSVRAEQLAYVMYTSGSTGRPKGVMVPHRQILNWLHNLWDKVPFGDGEVVAQKTSPAFAISVKELLAGLLAGVPQLFVDAATVKDVPTFVRALRTHGVTRLYSFPSQLRAVLAEVEAMGTPLASMRHLFVSIEPCPVELIVRLRETMPWARSWYIYGCTEVNDITYCDPGEQLASRTGFVSIGRPIRNTRVHVLDADLRSVPMGVMGEIHIESLGLARGYWEQPGLTAERFIANPHGAPGSRLYRTGDMARYLEDGTLEFLGRRDHEVKVRGYRVDARQVSRVIGDHPLIGEVETVGWPLGSRTPQLVAYVVAQPGEVLLLEGLREYLLDNLPTYMVPTLLHELVALPRLPNGKVDLQSLPEPDMVQASAAFQPPRTPTEQTLANMWGELLVRDGMAPPKVGVHDNFFTLGGHSLLAAQLFARVRQAFALELPISTLFEAPMLEAFAKAVDAARAAPDHEARSAIAPVPRDGPLPLSYLQERLWFVHEHMHEQRTSYNVAFSYAVHGKGLSIDALRRAVDALVARHETLRTTFSQSVGNSAPMQQIAPMLKLDIPVIEVRQDEVAQHLRDHAGQVFDLRHGPLLQLAVLRLAIDHHVIMVNMHHAICDGWSIGVFFRDLHALYLQAAFGDCPNLPSLPIQYADYAVWQRARDVKADVDYWVEKLQGYDEGFALPYDRVRPLGLAWKAGSTRMRYPAELAARVAALSADNGSTLFMTLLASMAIVLKQYSKRDDLCVGTTIGGREVVELEPLIGFFVNILPFRLDLSDNPSGRELLARVRGEVLAGIEHRHAPFEHVLNALRKHRDASQVALVPVVVRHQNFPAISRPDVPGDVHFGPVEFGERTTPSEIDIQFAGDGTALEVTVEYASALFDEPTIMRLLYLHQLVLETLTATPELRLSDFPTSTPRERGLLDRVNATGRGWADAGTGIVELFERQVVLHSGSAASVGSGGLSYGELNVRANRIAHALMARGVGPEVPVVVLCERSSLLLAALMGVFKAGGCYVPVDMGYPAGYVAQILADVRPQVVLAQRGAAVPAEWAGATLWLEAEVGESAAAALAEVRDPPLVPVLPQQLACILYTSGSTGAPKGVMVPHAQIENWLRAAWERWPAEPGEVMLQKTSVAFAVSVKELLSGLLAGMPQLLLGEEEVRDAARLAAAVARWDVTRIHLVPSHLKALLEGGHAGKLGSLRLVVTAGEPLPRAVAEQALGALPGAALWNNYGCTELNDTTYHRVEASDVGAGAGAGAGAGTGGGYVPIGWPLANTRVHVLDANLRPVPLGAMGELCVESVGLARGYREQPGLTAERFVANPYGVQGSRLYRTGDMVRHLPDGQLEYLGRQDHEVKIRGYRIDLRQVSQAIAAHPDVGEQAVLGWPRGGTEQRLVAYVALRAGETLPPGALAAWLRDRLPTYMVPSLIEELPRLPRLANGKIDYLALPEPRPADTTHAYTAPRNPREHHLAAIFADVLGIPKVGIHDNFFALGGHSLLAAQIIARVCEAFAVQLPMNVLLEAPTVAGLADPLRLALTGEAPMVASGKSIIRLAGAGDAPSLVCLHPVGGQVHVYADLAEALGDRACVLGLRSEWPRPFADLSALASHYCDLVLEAASGAPVRLLGWSSGGLIAMAITEELARRRQPVAYLGLIDTQPISAVAMEGGRGIAVAAVNILGTVRRRNFSVPEVMDAYRCLEDVELPKEQISDDDSRRVLRLLAGHFGITVADETWDFLASRLATTHYYLRLLAGYVPDTDVLAHLYVAEQSSGGRGQVLDVASQTLQVHRVDGDHYSMMRGENARALARTIAPHLDATI